MRRSVLIQSAGDAMNRVFAQSIDDELKPYIGIQSVVHIGFSDAQTNIVTGRWYGFRKSTAMKRSGGYFLIDDARIPGRMIRSVDVNGRIVDRKAVGHRS